MIAAQQTGPGVQSFYQVLPGCPSVMVAAVPPLPAATIIQASMTNARPGWARYEVVSQVKLADDTWLTLNWHRATFQHVCFTPFAPLTPDSHHARLNHKCHLSGPVPLLPGSALAFSALQVLVGLSAASSWAESF